MGRSGIEGWESLRWGGVGGRGGDHEIRVGGQGGGRPFGADHGMCMVGITE